MAYNLNMGKRRKQNKNYPPHLHLKSGRFYFVIRLNGKSKWFPLKTSDESEALKRWAEIESALRQKFGFNASQIEAQTENKITLTDLAERYLNEITPTKALKSQINEQRMMKAIVEKLGNVYVHKLTRQELIRWHDSMRSMPYEANRRLALLRHMLHKAMDWGYLTVNPADKIKKNKEKRHKLQLTDDILFKEIYPVATPMFKRAIMLAFHLVQHENELKKLLWKDFDFQKKEVRFIRQKTNEDIVINFSKNTALNMFLDHIRSTRKELSPYVVCYPSKIGWQPYASFRTLWHKALKDAGYEKRQFKFKELRHLANTCMKDGGITADKRKAMTGHVSIATNEIYTHKTGADTMDASGALSRYRPENF